MDEIQKVLIAAGRKDLAVKYYKKTAVMGGYLEVILGRDEVDNALKEIKTTWEAWKEAAETKPSDLEPAKRELKNYLKKQIDKLIV